MCGICGVFSFGSDIDPAVVQRMNQTLYHRGPDDEGYLSADTKAGIFTPKAGKDTIAELKYRMQSIEATEYPVNLVLGHRRLSIIDLSEKGHQPMARRGNWIVYNGEIYNYLELRAELSDRGHIFETSSDTEVILAAYEEWGLDCLRRFNGMWAFALWDLQRESLICSRDRFGIKPFYFASNSRFFLFGSEIKSILASDLIRVKANENAIFDFLMYGMVDHFQETFFKGIYRLMPGEYLTVDRVGKLLSKRWWHFEKKAAPKNISGAFRELFEDSIRLRLRSDVPVGSCLSGGLDSSYVVAQMATFVKDVNTFSAVYGKGIYGDESEFIDCLVKRTGAIHHTVIPRPRDLKEDIQKLVYHQEEPFGGTAIFAQWKVMELAKNRSITVLLDGQGADEQMGGYHQHFGIYFSNLFKRFRWYPLTRNLIDYLRLHKNRKIFDYLIYYTLPGKMKKWSRGMLTPLNKDFFRKYPDNLPPTYPGDMNEVFSQFVIQNLPQLLRFEDKNSMAFARETRLPFLDYRLVELIYSLPLEEKLGKGVTKRVMRKAMNGMVPDKIKNRHDKVGFETPEAAWFRSELQPFISEIIHSKMFSDRPYWDAEAVIALYDRFLQGRGASNIIWRFLSTELWLELFFDLK
ncbi:asparagine synthase (glutamine-hydrolyzing) [Candidatus Parcubacteria bacterium]|nr:MAG: asparagine synthase (glutamine-hydrolyzing) [Candidatus Parcubacteria bacterium]